MTDDYKFQLSIMEKRHNVKINPPTVDEFRDD
jgi:hypothetical protein